MSVSPPAAEASHKLQVALTVALVALLPRLFVALAWSKEPVWDGHYYHFGAERLASGLGYSEDVWVKGALSWKAWVHYPVGYSAVLALPYALFGGALWVAPVLNAIFGSALAMVTYWLSELYLGEVRARLAGVLVAVHPGLIAYTALVMTELTAALLLMLAGLVALQAAGRFKGLVLAGVLLGLASLVRPPSLLVIPLVAFTLPGSPGKRLRASVLCGAFAALVILPWTLRNCQRLDGCALISTNGGWNLAIGAIGESGRFQTLRGSDGCPVVTGQVQQDRCWAQVGLRRIQADPGRWLGLIPTKLGETFSHESFAIEYLHEADPVAWYETRRVAARELLTGVHRWLMVAAALGVVALPRRLRRRPWELALQASLLVGVGLLAGAALGGERPAFAWLALFIVAVGLLPLPGRPPLNRAGIYLLGMFASVLLTHSVFFGEDRYHLVVTPVLCILAAGALRWPSAPSKEASATRAWAQ